MGEGIKTSPDPVLETIHSLILFEIPRLYSFLIKNGRSTKHNYLHQ